MTASGVTSAPAPRAGGLVTPKTAGIVGLLLAVLATLGLWPGLSAPASADEGFDLETILAVTRPSAKQVKIQIAVTNVGSGNATELQLGGDVKNLTIDTVTADGWSCDAKKTSFSCTRPALASTERSPVVTVLADVKRKASFYRGDVETIAAGADANPTNNYGYFAQALGDDGTAVHSPALSGTVWWDGNQNGSWDAGETGIAGVKIEVRYRGADAWTVTTGADGVYAIEWLWNGDFTVRIAAPAGYQFSTRTGGGAAPDPGSDVFGATGLSDRFDCSYRGDPLKPPATSGKELTDGAVDVDPPRPCVRTVDAALWAPTGQPSPKPEETITTTTTITKKGGGSKKLPTTGRELLTMLGTGALLVGGGAGLAFVTGFARRRRHGHRAGRD